MDLIRQMLSKIDWKTLNVKGLLDQLDVVSGAVLFLITANVLGMLWYCTIHKQPVDSAVLTFSLGVIAAHTGNNVLGKKDDKPGDPSNG